MGAPEFGDVVGLFEQACFDLGEVVGDVLFAEAEDLQGDGFDDTEVAAHGVGDAGVLDFDGEFLAGAGGDMDLADGGAVGGVGSEGVEEGFDGLIELAFEGAANEGPGKGRGGVLGLGELGGVGGGEKVFVDAQHLSEFERAAFEFAEAGVDGAGIAFIQVGAQR